MECPEAVAGINQGDEVTVDFTTGLITNITKVKLIKVNLSQSSYKDD